MSGLSEATPSLRSQPALVGQCRASREKCPPTAGEATIEPTWPTRGLSNSPGDQRRPSWLPVDGQPTLTPRLIPERQIGQVVTLTMSGWSGIMT